MAEVTREAVDAALKEIVDPNLNKDLVAAGEVTGQAARSVLDDMFRTGKSPDALVEEKGLRSIRDGDTLERMVDEVLAEHPAVADKIRGGQKEPVNFLVGMVMRKSSGRADAARVRKLLEAKL